RKLQNLIAVIRQRVRRDHLQRMERGSVRQMHEGNARLGITPCAHPSFDRGWRFRRRLPGENLAHAEHSFVHLIESYPERTNCPAIAAKRAARASPTPSQTGRIFEIDSNKRSVGVDVVRHPALKQSNGSLFAKRRSEDHGIREGDTSRIRTSR